MTVERLLSTARKELGIKEQPADSNRVKYNTAYYGREVSGGSYAWCAVFLWWCFREAGASELYYGGGKTAYCPTLLSYHRAQAVSDYRPGDVIFFNFDGKKNAQHVGLCEDWDGQYITTIDGNTGSGSEANGGSVMRRKRDKTYIVGAYRPNYQGGEQMSYEDWKKYMDRYLDDLSQQKAEPGYAGQIRRIVAAGVMSEVDGSIARPKSFLTREEAAVSYANLLGKISGQ